MQDYRGMRVDMVKAENVYTADHFRAANSVRITGIKPYIAIAVLLLFTAVCGSFALVRTYKAWLAGRNADGFILMTSGIILLWQGYRLAAAVRERDELFEKAASKNIVRRFEVYENEILEFCDSETEHSERHFSMPGIFKAYDTGAYFIIYMYEDLFCMIGYDDITEGTPAELRSLLSNAVGDRLIIRR